MSEEEERTIGDAFKEALGIITVFCLVMLIVALTVWVWKGVLNV